LDLIVGTVFVLVYAGMALGGLPALRLGRAGIALSGAIALVLTGRMTPVAAWAAINIPTIALVLMVVLVSALLRVAGILGASSQRIVRANDSPTTLLALVIVVSGFSSAILANNVVCLAMAPLLIDICTRSRLDPVPQLLALACASNIGSAATLIGNPQTILIGQTLQLPFTRYLLDAGPPTIAGLLVVWLVIAWTYRDRWARESLSGEPQATPLETSPDRNRWREFLTLIDWRLLVLFVGLFVVNRAVAQAGLVSYYLMLPRIGGFDLASPPFLFAVTALLSNVLSAVPAVMLLLPAARAEIAGPVLALASSFAGNFHMAGSVATIAVVDYAARRGHVINRKTYARIGTPVTLISLGLVALWLWFLSGAYGARL
jgi:Na+/H+ antiporter NhaD/arsenite permease-like protein